MFSISPIAVELVNKIEDCLLKTKPGNSHTSDCAHISIKVVSSLQSDILVWRALSVFASYCLCVGDE